MYLHGVDGSACGAVRGHRHRRADHHPCGEASLGRVVDLLGQPLDGKRPGGRLRSLPDPPARTRVRGSAHGRRLSGRAQGHRSPGTLRQRREDRPLRRRWGSERQFSSRSSSETSPRCTEVIRCSLASAKDARGTISTLEMSESGVLSSTALVFGQMDQPPGARLRVGLTGLTIAELRDRGQDVLLFIDNIFRFVQAGSGYRLCLNGCLPPSVTSRHWRRRWDAFRSGSHRRPAVRSPRFRPSTCLLMTRRTPRRRRRSLTSMRRLCSALHCGPRHLPRRRSSGVVLEDPGSQRSRRAALPRRPRCAGSAPAVPRSA